MRRREFLVTGAATACAAAAEAQAYATANEKPIRVGLIGSGWYGKTDLFHLMQVAQVDVVGVCDVDSKLSAEAAQLISKRQPSGKVPPTYVDYRELLSKEQPEIVLIGTPDHWHCLPMVEACAAGADVYVQKPISWDVVEGQAMVAAARKYNRTVQVGLQRRSTPHLLQARDRFIRSGKLGKVGYVDIHAYGGGPRSFPPSEPAPDHLDWDRYVGPAPWCDYNPGIHPRKWRAYREFSNGKTGDLCVHFLDAVRYFLDLGWPRSISATGGRYMLPADSEVKLHDTQTAMFDYGETQLVWTQRNWGTNPEGNYGWGATLYGEKGTLKISVRSYDFIPKGRGNPEHGDWLDESDQYPEDSQHKETEMFAAPATRRHMQDFITARSEGRRPVADIAEGHASTACCLLANLSMRLGRSLQWDEAAGKVVGDDEANNRLAREYRGDWIHPTPDSV